MTTKARGFTISLDAIVAYEAGKLDHEGICDLFQTLVDTGMAWKLQGHYGRTAQQLIDSGDIVAS